MTLFVLTIGKMLSALSGGNAVRANDFRLRAEHALFDKHCTDR